MYVTTGKIEVTTVQLYDVFLHAQYSQSQLDV